MSNDSTELFATNGSDQHLFESLDHARRQPEWLWRYNNERPNMAIGGITPKQKLEAALNFNPYFCAPLEKGGLQSTLRSRGCKTAANQRQCRAVVQVVFAAVPTQNQIDFGVRIRFQE